MGKMMRARSEARGDAEHHEGRSDAARIVFPVRLSVYGEKLVRFVAVLGRC
jgi:hypothetical protein